MILLPIVARELRVASRRAGTYWTRFVFALLAIVVGSFVWVFAVREAPRQTGLALFVALAVIAFIYSLLAGALSTADCVSEEKREGTLGLLFLTDLKSYDIVLGKLAASSLTGIYGLLAIFPIMGVPLLLGGVTPGEFWRVVLVCLNNLFLSLTLGMLCSAICNDERKAIGLTMTTILLLTAGVPGVSAWIASESVPRSFVSSLFGSAPWVPFALSPTYTCFFAFDETQKNLLGAHRDWFYISLACTHLLAWLALVLTMIILPRVWQDKAASKEVMRRRATWRQWTLGGDDARAAFRRRLLDINPFYWLTSRERFKVALVWLWLGVGAIFWLIGLWREKRDWLNEGIFVCTALLAHSSLKCWLAMEASRRLGLDRHSGALELLLSTPLRVEEILRGQWLALRRQFGAAAALICAVDLLFLALGMQHRWDAGPHSFWNTMWLAGLIVFVLDLVTLAPLTMWFSLSARRPSRAGTTALVLVCVVPWAAFGALGMGMSLLHEVFGVRLFDNLDGSDLRWVMFLAWFAFSVLNDWLLTAWSLRNLRTKFRLVATQRVEARGGFWSRWFGRKPAELRK